MTDKAIQGIATLLEETFPGAYLRKNHNGLVQALTCYIAPYKADEVMGIIREYAEEYENAPNVGTIVKLLKRKANGKDPKAKPKYIEDNDGCGYMWDELTHDYECIWKWWWAEKGVSKMETLRSYGLADY